MSHLSYTQLNLLTGNAVYSRLQEKAEKLLSIAHLAQPGILLCDGDCDAFRNHRSFASYHIDDVIHAFLERFPEIAFVITIFVEQYFGFDAFRKFVPALYFGKTFAQPDQTIVKLVQEALSFLPDAKRSAKNARNHLKSSTTHKGDSFSGGQTIGDGMIKIPARVILDLLAGRIDQEEFFRIQHFAPAADEEFPMPNPFASELNHGRLISSLKLDRQLDKDDDWIIFEFDGPDPAIAPYRVPPTP